MAAEQIKKIAQNKKAYHDYFILETYEAGIELFGTEVKSIREGRINLKDSWCRGRRRRGQVRDRGVAIDELSPLIRGGLIHSQLGDGFFGGEPDELVHSVGVGGRVIRFVGLLEDMGQRFGFAGTGGEEPRMA